MGPVRADTNVVWDLAPHDVSIFQYLMGGTLPVRVSATGACVLDRAPGTPRPSPPATPDRPGSSDAAAAAAAAAGGGAVAGGAAGGGGCLDVANADVAFITLFYPGNVVAHVHVSWVEPKKVRELSVVGSQQRIEFDDMSPQEPIRVYNKGVAISVPTPPGSPKAGGGGAEPDLRTFADHLTFRDGDILSPKCPSGAPLTKQVDHFLACCATHGREGGEGEGGAVAPRTPAESGVAVVRILEAACVSMRQGGVPVDITTAE